MKNKPIIFITGGHITPAIALIDALNDKKETDIVFIGRYYAIEGSKIASAEYQLITEKNIRFLPILAGRHTFPSFFKIPIGFLQSLAYCREIKPSLVVSFGGYVSLPVALAAWFCGIPVVTHEQTMVPGLANKIIAKIAKRVCVTFPETEHHFTSSNVVYTGLPMRKELFTLVKKSPFPLDIAQFPLIYITGGGTGAQSLNRLVFPIVSELIKKYSIIHQVGDVSLPEAQAIQNDQYFAASYFSSKDVSWIMTHASLVVGRSGANTAMELAALGKVAVFVPLPWSAGGEQKVNANWLAKNGGAVVLKQEEITPQELEKQIENTMTNIASLESRARTFAVGIPRDGAARLVHEIEQVLHLPA